MTAAGKLTPQEEKLLAELRKMTPAERAAFSRRTRPFDPAVNVGKVWRAL